MRNDLKVYFLKLMLIYKLKNAEPGAYICVIVITFVLLGVVIIVHRKFLP